METSYQGSMEKCARSVGINLPVSRKMGYEMSNALRGKEVAKAIKYLEDVIAMVKAVPVRRHNFDVAHKPGIAAGKYPIKLAKQYLKILKSAKANAIDQGLNGDNLKLIHITATHGASTFHHGRQKRSQFKSSNVDMIVKEVEPVTREAKVDKKKKAETKKEEAKAE